MGAASSKPLPTVNVTRETRQQDDGFQPAQPQHKKHHKQHYEKHEEPAPAPVHEPAPRKEHSPSPPRHQEGRPHGNVVSPSLMLCYSNRVLNVFGV